MPSFLHILHLWRYGDKADRQLKGTRTEAVYVSLQTYGTLWPLRIPLHLKHAAFWMLDSWAAECKHIHDSIPVMYPCLYSIPVKAVLNNRFITK